MELYDFLQRVLPDSGQYFAASAANNRLNQHPASTITSLVGEIATAQKRRKDTYVAIGSYVSSDNRRSENVHLKKAFYLDVDCGDKKPYPTKQDGINALLTFCKQVRLPAPSIIVDSGGGLHVYWVLDVPIDRATWLPIANGLKAACTELKFEVDQVVTADSTRVMRVPGSVNYKKAGTPRTVSVVLDSGKEYGHEELEQALGEYMMQGRPRNVVSILTGTVDNSDLSDGVGGDYGPKRFHFIRQECGAMQQVVHTGGRDCGEGAWKDTLSLLAFCKDGENFVHVVSNKHPDYTKEGTLEKWAKRLEAKHTEATRPPLCNTFKTHFPEKCEKCPHRTKINSPIALGVPHEEQLPDQYVQSNNGIWKRSDDIEKPMRFIAPARISEFNIVTDEEMGLTAVFKLRTGKQEAYASYFLGSGAEANSTSLALFNLALLKTQKEDFRDFIVAWANEMLKKKAPDRATRSFGWRLDGKRVGFANGASIFWEDNKTTSAIRFDPVLSGMYSPEGELEAWNDAVNLQLKQNRPQIEAIIATAFAAPLVKYVGVSGLMVSAVSAKSGTGKSSAIKTAQAVWGCPKRGINSLNDTSNSVAKKISTLNNLPAYWDELHIKDDIENFIKLVFQLGQGKDKSRLNQGAEMQDTGSWTTMITVASNDALLDHMQNRMTGTNAGAMRLFEFNVPPTTGTATLSEAMNTFGKLENNYGRAGEIYAQWLTANHQYIEKTIYQHLKAFETKLKPSSNERFWVATITALYCGARFAGEAGLVQFNMKALASFLINHMLEQRVSEHTQSDEEISVIDIVDNYLNDVYDKTLVTNYIHTNKGRAGGVVSMKDVPKQGTVVQIGVESSLIRINLQPFIRWLYRRKITPSHVINELKNLGVVQHRAAIGSGVLPAAARRQVLDIDTNLAEFSYLMDEEN